MMPVKIMKTDVASKGASRARQLHSFYRMCPAGDVIWFELAVDLIAFGARSNHLPHSESLVHGKTLQQDNLGNIQDSLSAKSRSKRPPSGPRPARAQA